MQTVALPNEIPRGGSCLSGYTYLNNRSCTSPTAKFVVDAKVFTQDDEPAACINLMINFLVPDA